jgi:hypothetical protein
MKLANLLCHRALCKSQKSKSYAGFYTYGLGGQGSRVLRAHYKWSWNTDLVRALDHKEGAKKLKVSIT